ncbi:MAG: hypothetical protein PVF70_05095 [Anaerolineales bacterium]|jgi:hypothetical protein
MRRKSIGQRFVEFLKNVGKVLLGIFMFFLAIGLGQCCQQISPFTREEATSTPRPTPTIALTAVPDIKGNLVDLLEAGQIEARPRGSSIEELELDLKRLLDELIEVEIEVGTYFVAHSGSVQNMVVLQEAVVRLDMDGWIEVLLDVACGNIRRSIPDGDETFDIQRASEQVELQMLLESLASPQREGWEYSSYDVQQAAIWIITDNADYGDLGILVRSTSITGIGSRVIGYDDAARAMQLVDDAGIDITTRAIWEDRDAVAEGVTDSALADWIRARSAEPDE